MAKRQAALAIAVVIVVALAVLAAYHSHTASQWWEEVRPAVEADLGFRYGTPYKNGREVLMIVEVEPAGPVATAGVEEGYCVQGYRSVASFFRDLDNARGAEMELRMTRPDGTPVTVTVQVPRRVDRSQAD